MDIIKNNAPLVMVIALSLKGLAFGISFADASVAVSLVGLLALRDHLDKHKRMQEVEKSTQEQLDKMCKTIQTQNEVIAAQALEFDKIRNAVSGLKLQYGVQPITGNRKQG